MMEETVDVFKLKNQAHIQAFQTQMQVYFGSKDLFKDKKTISGLVWKALTLSLNTSQSDYIPKVHGIYLAKK